MGDFFKKILDNGADCRRLTVAKLVAWFDSNWSSDIEWPKSVPRP